MTGFGSRRSISVLQGVQAGIGMQSEARMEQYVEALERYPGGRLSCVEAARLLGVSERHFRRLSDLVQAEGLIGSGSGLSGRRAPMPGSNSWWSNIGPATGTSR